MPEEPAAIVRSRSLPGQKRVTAPEIQWPTHACDFPRTSLALRVVAAETGNTPQAQKALQDLADSVLHDFLRVKSSEFHRGLEHGRWLHQAEKNIFCTQTWELRRAYEMLSALNTKYAVLETMYESTISKPNMNTATDDEDGQSSSSA